MSYTEQRIRYCQARKHAIEHFAGRWAAKEAILKAMGTGWSRGLAWTDVEVRTRGTTASPDLRRCRGELALQKGIGEILISISHCRTSCHGLRWRWDSRSLS